MQAVVLSIHLVLALALIVVVLLQRSEGGGLGMGGGGVMTSRGAATALSKLTWVIGGAFVVTSLALTILAASNSRSGSVIDGIETSAPAAGAPAVPDLGTDLLPKLPAAADEGPATPPAPDAPVSNAPVSNAPASDAPATAPAPAAETPATPPAAPATPPAADAPAAPPPSQ